MPFCATHTSLAVGQVSSEELMERRPATFEKHYRVKDLATLWGLGRETVRKIVSAEPDVVKIRMGRKKAHTVYSVPESVAHRIHRRLTDPA